MFFKTTLLYQIIFFIKKPSSIKITDRSTFNWSTLLRIIVTNIFVLLLIIALIHAILFVLEYLNIPRPLPNKLNDISQQFSSKLMLFLVMCIWGPIVEECVFRLGLTLRKRDLGIAFAMLYIGLAGHIFASFSWQTLLRLAIAIAIFIGVYKIEILHRFIEQKKETVFNVVIYLSIMTFGLVHITNFSPLTAAQIPYYMVLMLPQLFAGILLAFIRLRYGFGYAVLYHSANNSIAFLITM